MDAIARPTPEAVGFRLGWDDAARYARGTRRDRREIRRRLAKAEVSGAEFWQGYQWAMAQRCQAFAEAIAEGQLPRTVNPKKLANLCSRAWAVEVAA